MTSGDSPCPLFVLSLPRSGSTLLQRVLGSYPEIDTASEPWILLALLSPLHEDLPGRAGREPLVARAVSDFCEQLPGGVDDYRREMRETALRLYGRAAEPGVRYYLDKTPMYHLIVEDIIDLFPEAKVVFLWRNPLSVVASTVELFHEGRWEVSRYYMSLFRSVSDLTSSFARHGDRTHAVRYEDLLNEDDRSWRSLMDYLDLRFDPSSLRTFRDVDLHGRMGDPVGPAMYSSLSQEPLTKWRAVINNPVRKHWCRRYLHWIGRERLALMGYELDDLLGELERTPSSVRGSTPDLARLGASIARDLIKARAPGYAGGPSVWPSVLGR